MTGAGTKKKVEQLPRGTTLFYFQLRSYTKKAWEPHLLLVPRYKGSRIAQSVMNEQRRSPRRYDTPYSRIDIYHTT